MIVYHGSTDSIPRPDNRHSQNHLDFGRGFYVTTFQEQAARWAKRKAMRKGGSAVVNVYDLSESFDGFNVLTFPEDNEAWLDYVCSCRKGSEDYLGYDLVIGNVANDDVFRTIDMYFRGIWDKERTIAELRFYKLNDQYCLISQAMIDQNLKFIRSYEVTI